MLLCLQLSRRLYPAKEDVSPLVFRLSALAKKKTKTEYEAARLAASTLMNKNARMAAFVESLATGGDPRTGNPARHPCYLGYFRLFNEARYYEAHDVLEHLWLDTARDGSDPNFLFYKALIQVAGAFVHLQKQHAFPDHPKHGRRLRPATRLFALAARNLDGFPPRHLGLDVAALRARCVDIAAEIAAADFSRNPWTPETAPRLALDGSGGL